MSEYKKESNFRSFLKSITWRITATFTTVLIARIIIGDTGTALKIGAIEATLKILIYYLHERVWQIIPRGTIRSLFRKKT